MPDIQQAAALSSPRIDPSHELPAPQSDAEGGQDAPHDLSNDKQSHQTDNHEEHSGQDQGEPPSVSFLGWLTFAVVAVLALLFAGLAIYRSTVRPRTDDAEVFANYIALGPLVEGPILQLPVRDNELVHAGQLLFIIDERPYRYALERALSEQAALEGQILDRTHSINAQLSNVDVQAASVLSSRSNREAMAADISQAQANLRDAIAALHRVEADQRYAADNLHRLEPLLAQQFVTADQVDQARTLLETRTRAVQQAEAQIGMAEAQIASQKSHFDQSSADVAQHRAQRDQATNEVQVMAPLTSQREERQAAIRLARYNLENCRVYAPFDGYVTNLTTSLGAYVRAGTQVFTMIDAREWWVIANFRETQLKHVVPGSAADVFLMQRDALPLRGVVESVGFGVTPDPSVAGVNAPGLPAVQRTLNWVHLAARYPVRIRVLNPPPNLLRIGQSAVAVVHPYPAGAQ